MQVYYNKYANIIILFSDNSTIKSNIMYNIL